MLLLAHLLDAAGIDPLRTLVLRHAPTEPKLRRAFPRLIRDRPELLDPYQRIQVTKAARLAERADWMVSLFGRGRDEAVFLGVFGIDDAWEVATDAEWQLPDTQQLVAAGMQRPAQDTLTRLALERDDRFSDYEQRLLLRWPTAPINWCRMANQHDFPITAWLPASVFDGGGSQ